MRHLALATLLVQEGGYPCAEFGGNLARSPAGLEAVYAGYDRRRPRA